MPRSQQAPLGLGLTCIDIKPEYSLTLTDVGPGILNYYKATDYASPLPNQLEGLRFRFRLKLKLRPPVYVPDSHLPRPRTARRLGSGCLCEFRLDVFFVSKDKEGQGSDSGFERLRGANSKSYDPPTAHCILSLQKYPSSLHTLNLCIQYVRAGRPGLTSCPCGRFALLMAPAQ